MELDELKHIWQHTQTSAINQEVINNEQVMEMTRQKSKDVMTKLKTNLNFDITVNALFIPPLIYVLFMKNIATYHKYIAGFFIVYTFVSIYLYWKEVKLYRKLNTSNDLLSTLRFTAEKFSQRVKALVFFNNVALLPLMFYGSVIGSEVIRYQNPDYDISVITLLIITACITPIGYFYMTYIIKKLYGEHLQKLKELLTELEQN